MAWLEERAFVSTDGVKNERSTNNYSKDAWLPAEEEREASARLDLQYTPEWGLDGP